MVGNGHYPAESVLLSRWKPDWTTPRHPTCRRLKCHQQTFKNQNIELHSLTQQNMHASLPKFPRRNTIMIPQPFTQSTNACWHHRKRNFAREYLSTKWILSFWHIVLAGNSPKPCTRWSNTFTQVQENVFLPASHFCLIEYCARQKYLFTLENTLTTAASAVLCARECFFCQWVTFVWLNVRCLGAKENVLPVSKWALSDSMLPSLRQESKQPLSFSPIESPETRRISAG